MSRVGALLAIAMFLFPTVALSQKKTKSVDRLKKGLEDVRQSKKQAEKKLGKTKANITDVKKQMGVLEGNLERISGDLESTTDQLSEAQSRQKTLEKELVQATKDVQAKKLQVEKRMRTLYKEGKPNVLEFVFGSKSSADLSTREFVADRIQKADRKLFQDFRAERDAAKKKKQEQDEVVQRIASLHRQQESKQHDLADAQRAKESYLHGLESKKEDLENVLDELDSDAAAIDSEIKVAMARARAAETRKATEAQKKGETYTPPKFSGGFVRPTGGPTTSGFGSRYHPILHYTRMHSGLDFGGGYGAPVYAAASGVVIGASTRGGYGNCIIIDHGNGRSTVYGHLSRIMVSEGQTVTSHQRIGSIGASGLATGPHLHFEIRINGKAVNPARYL